MKKRVKSEIFRHNFLRKNHRGNILAENTLFLILNLIFIVILIIFLASRMGNVGLLEESYAKQIALMVDNAKLGTAIFLNMEKGFKKAEKNFPLEDAVSVDNENNIITVKFREKGGYSYSFFNDVEVNVHLDTTNNKDYVIIISEAEENE